MIGEPLAPASPSPNQATTALTAQARLAYVEGTAHSGQTIRCAGIPAAAGSL